MSSGGKKRSAKALLTQDQIIPGLGNAIAQDILFRARLHPRHPIADLSQTRGEALYDAIWTRWTRSSRRGDGTTSMTSTATGGIRPPHGQERGGASLSGMRG